MRRGRDETRSRSMKRTQQKLAITNNKKKKKKERKKKNEAEDSLHVQENWFLAGPTRGIPRGRELKPSYPLG